LTRTVVVTLPLPSIELNPHAKGHWRKKYEHTVKARELARLLALKCCGSNTPMFSKATVSMFYDCSPKRTIKGYRPRDVQNAVSACKAYIDGCADAGVIVDDNAKILSWGKCVIVNEGKPGVTLVFEGITVPDGGH